MKTINFSGQNWFIKSGNVIGPGNNNWNNNNVSVDSDGNLHLRINKVDDKWYCAEIFTEDFAPWGEYFFFVSTDIEKLDKNIVTGLFIYQDDKHELDIEFYNGMASYSIQPSLTKEFKLNLQGNFSTHYLYFSNCPIAFSSSHGHYLHSQGNISNYETWSGEKPEPRKSKLHINFWLKNGNPPTDGEDAELIIKSVTFKKLKV